MTEREGGDEPASEPGPRDPQGLDGSGGRVHSRGPVQRRGPRVELGVANGYARVSI